MPSMTSYDRGDVVLAILPFSDLTGVKQRPAVVVSAPHPSVDLLLLALTSQLAHLQLGKFTLADWKNAGLLFPSAVMRREVRVRSCFVQTFESLPLCTSARTPSVHLSPHASRSAH